MLTHLCRDELIQIASSIRHPVFPTASSPILHPNDWQATSMLLVLAHVRSSNLIACASQHSTPSWRLVGHGLPLSAPSRLNACCCSAPPAFASRCRSLHQWPTGMKLSELHHPSVTTWGEIASQHWSCHVCCQPELWIGPRKRPTVCIHRWMKEGSTWGAWSPDCH